MDKNKQKTVVKVSEQSVTVEEKSQLSTSDLLWNEIKDKEVSMFALPNQKVSDYCSKVVVEPTKLYLVSSISSFLPALEGVLGSKYQIDLVDKYIVVSKKTTLHSK